MQHPALRFSGLSLLRCSTSLPELMFSSCADVQRGVMQGKASQPRVLTCSTGAPVVLICSTGANTQWAKGEVC